MSPKEFAALRFTPEEVKQIQEFYLTHSYAECMKEFKVSEHILHLILPPLSAQVGRQKARKLGRGSLTPSGREKLRQSGQRAALRSKKCDTRPELQMQARLQTLGLTLGTDFFKQYPIQGYLVDFAVPKLNLLIEVHGNYWHANPKFYDPSKWTKVQKYNVGRDQLKLAYLQHLGWRVHTVWEDEVGNFEI